MTRTIQDRYFEGTITVADLATDPGNPSQFVINMLVSKMLQTIDGNPCWDQYDVYDGGAEVIYRTLGDRNLAGGVGDALGYLEIFKWTTTRVAYRSWHDWSGGVTGTPTHTGHSGDEALMWHDYVDAVDIDYFGCVNEYELVWITHQNGTWLTLWCGNSNRSHVPFGHRGVARITQEITGTGSAQTVTVDRSMVGNILLGEKVWLRNVTPLESTLRSDSMEACTITAVDATSVEINPIGNYLSDAFIGLDFSPFYKTDAIGGGSIIAFTTTQAPSEAAGNRGNLVCPAMHNTPTVQDDAVYPLGGPAYWGVTVGSDGWRGHSDFAHAFTGIVGATPDRQASSFADAWRVDLDDNKKFAPFSNSGFAISGGRLALGPFNAAT